MTVFRRTARQAAQAMYTDRPITQTKDDVLGRASVALRIAQWVRDAPHDQGFVIGVTGAWGSGKTSLLNMVAEQISAERTIIRFDPWLFANSDQLVVRFFDELAGQLAQGRGRRSRKLARRLAEYGAAVAPAASVVIGPAGQLAAAPERIAQLSDRSASKQRERVRELLRSEKARVAVFIDDIDRLDAHEVREVMRLAKLVADLPGVVHVLSYDRGRVQEALTDDYQHGRAFLEKIVQVSMAVPPVPRDRLRQLTIEALNSAIDERDLTAWDPEAWSEIFGDGLELYLQTVRDARRFANVVPAALDLTHDEVAAMDVLALEAMRVFDPDVHEALPSIAPDLTATSELFDFRDRSERLEQSRNRLDGVLKSSANELVTRTVLARLFPKAADALGGSMFGGGAAHRPQVAKRVQDLAVLRRYLHRSLATGEAPSRQVDRVIDAFADAGDLEQVLAATPDIELDDLLRRARRRLDEQPEPDVVGCSLVLLRCVPRLGPEQGFLDVSADRRALWLVQDLVRMLDEPHRASAATRIVEGAPTLSLRLLALWRFAKPDEPSKEPELDIFDEKQFGQLRAGLSKDIRAAGPEAIATETHAFWLVETVSEADGPAAALELLGDARLLAAVIQQPGTRLRPLTGRGVSLHLEPLVDAAGEDVLELLGELTMSRLLKPDVADELRGTLTREPDAP